MWRRASWGAGVTQRTYWTTYNCLPAILPHVSTARLEQPVEKIPVYFQKQIKAFRLCSANLGLKVAGKICSLPLSPTPRPLRVMTFRPASPPLSSLLPAQTAPHARLVLVCTVRAFSLWRTGDNGVEVDKKNYQLVQGEVSVKSMFLFIRILRKHIYKAAWSSAPHPGVTGQEAQSLRTDRPHLLTRSTLRRTIV